MTYLKSNHRHLMRSVVLTLLLLALGGCDKPHVAAVKDEAIKKEKLASVAPLKKAEDKGSSNVKRASGDVKRPEKSSKTKDLLPSSPESTSQADAKSLAGLPPKGKASLSAKAGNTPKVESAPKGESAKRITVEDVQRETNEALAAAEGYAKQIELDYHEQIEAKLGKFNAKLKVFQEKADRLGKQAKKRISRETKPLKESVNLSAQQIADLAVANKKELQTLEKNLTTMIAQLEKELLGN